MDKNTALKLLNKIPDAKVIRRELEVSAKYKQDIESAISYQNEEIKEAVERGESKTHFSCYNHKHGRAIKDLYIQKGYHFMPTGFSDRDLREIIYICW